MAIYIVLYLIFTVSGLVFMKLGAESANLSFEKFNFSLNFNLYLVLGLATYMISFLMWTVLLKKFDLSYIVPITTGISYVAVVISGLLIFKERIHPLNWIAIIIILLGIVLLNLPKK